MKKRIISLAFILLNYGLTVAQFRHAITVGSVNYEKSINNYALIKQMLGKNPDGLQQQKFEQYQKSQPQFTVVKSKLTFGNKKSLFVPEESAVTVFPLFNIPMTSQNNTVFNDFLHNTSVTQKRVFDNFFLIKDTVGKIRWKITDETREIAGYTCRRANALILDSVYVVAFYTDEIHVPSGPEIFSGLPGMILEVALPHEHVIWKATEVSLLPVPDSEIGPPKKGKEVTSGGFNELLRTLLENKDDPMGLLRKSLLL